MRALFLAHLDKTRPVLVLTRPAVLPYRTQVTIATVTSTIRGLSVEVPVGTENGLEGESVVNCDDIYTIPASSLGRHVGFLEESKEVLLAEAVRAAFDLEDTPL